MPTNKDRRNSVQKPPPYIVNLAEIASDVLEHFQPPLYCYAPTRGAAQLPAKLIPLLETLNVKVVIGNSLDLEFSKAGTQRLGANARRQNHQVSWAHLKTSAFFSSRFVGQASRLLASNKIKLGGLVTIEITPRQAAPTLDDLHAVASGERDMNFAMGILITSPNADVGLQKIGNDADQCGIFYKITGILVFYTGLSTMPSFLYALVRVPAREWSE